MLTCSDMTVMACLCALFVFREDDYQPETVFQPNLVLIGEFQHLPTDGNEENPSPTAGISPQVSRFNKKSCWYPEDGGGDVSACVEQMSLTRIFKNQTGPGNCDQ